MAHVTKFTKSTCGLLTRHYERYKDSEFDIKYKNQDIDHERTHLNYNLAPEHEQMDFLKKRLEEVHCLKRDNVNVMCDWVVTAPKELPEEHQREFFEVCYNHLADKYGENNVISAYVHMDENQPHMHFAFVPVVYDSEKNREKVSAKELLNKAHLKNFHPELQGVVNGWIKAKGYNIECNVLNGATVGGNKTVDELKLESLRISLDDISKQAQTKQNHVYELDSQLREKSGNVRRLDKDIDRLTAEKAELEQVVADRQGMDKLLNELNTAVEKANAIGERVMKGNLMLKRPAFGAANEVTLGSVQRASWELGRELEELRPVVQSLKQTEHKLTDMTQRTSALVEDRAQELVRQQQQQLLHDLKKAEKDRIDAERSKRRYEDLKTKEEDYIIGTAVKRSESLVEALKGQVFKQDLEDDRSARLEEYCKGIKFKDGRSVLDGFKEQEQELSARLDREYDKLINSVLGQGEAESQDYSEDWDFER